MTHRRFGFSLFAFRSLSNDLDGIQMAGPLSRQRSKYRSPQCARVAVLGISLRSHASGFILGEASSGLANSGLKLQRSKQQLVFFCFGQAARSGNCVLIFEYSEYTRWFAHSCIFAYPETRPDIKANTSR